MSRLDPPTYLQHIRDESQRFRDVLADCDPAADVPSVPRLACRRPALAPRRGAALVDLDGHAPAQGARRTTPSRSVRPTMPALLAFFDEHYAALVDALAAADPATRPGPGTPSTRTSPSSSAARPTRR